MKRILSILMVLSLMFACSKDEPKKINLNTLSLAETSWTGSMETNYSMITKKFSQKYYVYLSFDNEGKSNIKIFDEDKEVNLDQLSHIKYKQGKQTIEWLNIPSFRPSLDYFKNKLFFIEREYQNYMVLQANENTKDWIRIDLSKN